MGAVASLLFLLLAILGFVVWRRYCESAYYYLEDPPRYDSLLCPLQG